MRLSQSKLTTEQTSILDQMFGASLEARARRDQQQVLNRG